MQPWWAQESTFKNSLLTPNFHKSNQCWCYFYIYDIIINTENVGLNLLHNVLKKINLSLFNQLLFCFDNLIMTLTTQEDFLPDPERLSANYPTSRTTWRKTENFKL